MAQIQDYDKQQAIKQWSNDPCGLHQVRQQEIGTSKFYTEAEEDRNNEFPWLKSAGFSTQRERQ